MNDLFASFFEWFGLMSFYSADLGEHLHGLDITCSDHFGTPLYLYAGLVMVAVVVGAYILVYHLINSVHFNRKSHWWLTAIVVFAINFLVAFALPFSDLQNGNFCSQLRFGIWDCFGFGVTVALWGLFLFILLTSFPYPRRWSGYNMIETTFWKP